MPTSGPQPAGIVTPCGVERVVDVAEPRAGADRRAPVGDATACSGETSSTTPVASTSGRRSSGRRCAARRAAPRPRRTRAPRRRRAASRSGRRPAAARPRSRRSPGGARRRSPARPAGRPHRRGRPAGRSSPRRSSRHGTGRPPPGAGPAAASGRPRVARQRVRVRRVEELRSPVGRFETDRDDPRLPRRTCRRAGRRDRVAVEAVDVVARVVGRLVARCSPASGRTAR